MKNNLQIWFALYNTWKVEPLRGACCVAEVKMSILTKATNTCSRHLFRTPLKHLTVQLF
jgi:hypothetical protein